MNGRASKPDSQAAPRRRYHFHAPGVIYILVTLFLAIGALNSQNNLLFASLGLAIGGLLVSGILSGGSLMGVRLEREVLPVTGARIHAGDQVEFRYAVRNRNFLIPSFGLTIAESRNNSGFRPLAFVPYVPARGLANAAARAEAPGRGRFELGEVRAWTTFPFGLAKKSVSVVLPTVVTVHPVTLPIRPGVLQRLAVRAMSGSGAAAHAGNGDELYGVREYSDGDNPRWIAWRRSARTGQLLVRQNTTPSPRRIWIVLRLQPHGDPVQNETAIALASGLIRSSAAEGASVGLAIPGSGVMLQPNASARGLRVMLESLAILDVRAQTDAAFPLGAVRSNANVVVHAGAADRTYGSARSVHIGEAEVEQVLAPGEALDKARAVLARSAPPVPTAAHPRARRESVRSVA